jgi:hypothetical protein
MNLSDMNSLYTFIHTIKKIIDGYGIKNNSYYKPDDGFVCRDANYQDTNKNIHFLFGLGFWQKTPYVLIQFKNDCSKSIQKKLFDLESGEYYLKPESVCDGNGNQVGIDVYLCEKKFRMLCDNSRTINEQEKILEGFFKETLAAIG